MYTGYGAEIVAKINKLQGVSLSAIDSSAAQIDIPQICVLGSQGSVKGSVLEVRCYTIFSIHRLMAFVGHRWS